MLFKLASIILPVGIFMLLVLPANHHVSAGSPRDTEQSKFGECEDFYLNLVSLLGVQPNDFGYAGQDTIDCLYNKLRRHDELECALTSGSSLSDLRPNQFVIIVSDNRKPLVARRSNLESQDLIAINSGDIDKLSLSDLLQDETLDEILVVSNRMPTKGKAAVSFWGEKYDLGRLSLGVPIHHHSIPIINYGAATVTIDSIEFSCQCTESTSQDIVLQPFGVEYIDIKVHPQGRPVGKFQVSMLLKTSSEGYEDVVLVPIEALLEGSDREYGFYPSVVSITDLSPTDETRDFSVVVRTSDKSTKVETVFLQPGIRVQDIVCLGLGEHEVHLSIDADRCERDGMGRFACKALFDIGLEEGYAELAVVGRKRQSFDVFPNAVYLGELRPGDVVEQKLIISGEGQKTTKVTVRKSDNEIEVSRNPEGFNIMVTCPNELGSFRRTIIVASESHYVKLPIVAEVVSKTEAQN